MQLKQKAARPSRIPSVKNPIALQDRAALSVDEFCALIGVCRATFYNLLKDGKIRTVMLGGRRLVPADAVRELLVALP
jgi:excisionase family DNA binding protein